MNDESINDLEFDFGSNTDKKANDQPKRTRKKISEQETSDGVNAPEKELDFEVRLKRLETIVTDMENGKLSLEESIKHFEEGTKLANYCTTKLAETEKKVEILLDKDKKVWETFQQSSDGNPK